jgi:hypothetical protein
MSNQLVCDKCKKPIDTTGPWTTVNVLERKPIPLEPDPSQPPTPMMPIQVDYHDEHVPNALAEDIENIGEPLPEVNPT